MKVTELNKGQLLSLKADYMFALADEGTFAEVMGRDYYEPTWDDLANVDKYVPDDIIFKHYEGIDFAEEDFYR